MNEHTVNNECADIKLRSPYYINSGRVQAEKHFEPGLNLYHFKSAYHIQMSCI